MLSHVIPQRLVTNRIPIKLQLPGKSRLIFELLFTARCQDSLGGMILSARDCLMIANECLR